MLNCRRTDGSARGGGSEKRLIIGRGESAAYFSVQITRSTRVQLNARYLMKLVFQRVMFRMQQPRRDIINAAVLLEQSTRICCCCCWGKEICFEYITVQLLGRMKNLSSFKVLGTLSVVGKNRHPRRRCAFSIDCCEEELTGIRKRADEVVEREVARKLNLFFNLYLSLSSGFFFSFTLVELWCHRARLLLTNFVKFIFFQRQPRVSSYQELIVQQTVIASMRYTHSTIY